MESKCMACGITESTDENMIIEMGDVIICEKCMGNMLDVADTIRERIEFEKCFNLN